ncbi:MAG: OmpA family protein [Thermodesulfobacteriota bacterium]
MPRRFLSFLPVFLLLSCLCASLAIGAEPSPAPVDVRLVKQQAKLNVEPISDGKLLVSVHNDRGEAVLGLRKEDFAIKQGMKAARILSVEDVSEERNVGLNLVLVVDNSYSMEQRKAVEPLLDAMNRFLSLVRPIDNVHIVTFVDPKADTGTRTASRVFQASDRAALEQFLRGSFFPNTTTGTYLYDSMRKGLEIVQQMPPDSQKFMIVFSDGEDINSASRAEDVRMAAQGLRNFTAYAVDYMDKPGLDSFLQSFAQGHDGMIRKATSASDFLPILKHFSTTIFHRYLVTYRFLAPPAGLLNTEPAALTLEEVTMVDSSPMLNYVYFETGKAQIPDRYSLLTGPEQTSSFSEEALRGTMEKYHHVLNIIGKRLRENPEARIRIVGCNSNSGVEKGNLALSKKRAEAVFLYLNEVWGIAAGRMELKSQNLPTVPSSPRVPEGVIENQRVEILTDHPAILDTIKSTYIQEQTDTKEIRLKPAIEAEAGVESWRLNLLGDGKGLASREGSGPLPESILFGMEELGVHAVAQLGQLTAEIEVKDKEGNLFRGTTAAPLAVKLLKREERIAQKLGSKVVEKYGLILFEFDRADLKDRNQIIVNRVLSRLSALPSPVMDIAGHTDIIGKEEYNIELSSRRARAVYDATIKTGLVGSQQLTAVGNGPRNPPYDNSLPEGRALNRTVIISLQYME